MLGCRSRILASYLTLKDQSTEISEPVTFFCRLHFGGETGEILKSSIFFRWSEVELGVDSQKAGILHSTSDGCLANVTVSRLGNKSLFSNSATAKLYVVTVN